MSGAHLLVRYVAFAALATLANLAAQRLVLAWAQPIVDLPPALAYWAAVGTGTAAGLVLKYALDKRWIFHDRSTGLHGHGRRFPLYVLMGVATTVIFWGTETVFWLASGSQALRETGAVIGLAIGYAVKYRLDRRFVFTGTGSTTGRAHEQAREQTA